MVCPLPCLINSFTTHSKLNTLVESLPLVAACPQERSKRQRRMQEAWGCRLSVEKVERKSRLLTNKQEEDRDQGQLLRPPHPGLVPGLSQDKGVELVAETPVWALRYRGVQGPSLEELTLVGRWLMETSVSSTPLSVVVKSSACVTLRMVEMSVLA